LTQTGIDVVAPAPAEVVVLSVGDRIVQRIMSLMISGDWRGERSSQDIALEWGCSIVSAREWSRQAGRFLRLQRVPGELEELIIAQVRGILEESGSDRMLAARVLLDRVDRLIERRERALARAGQAQAPEALERHGRMVLHTPPADLSALLEEQIRQPSPWWADALDRAGWVRQ
jgi:hypothetical protein